MSVYFVWSILMHSLFAFEDNILFTLVQLTHELTSSEEKFSQLIRMCFFVALFREFNVTLRFYQRNIFQFRSFLILIDTMFVGVLILWGKFKLWSVLELMGSF